MTAIIVVLAWLLLAAFNLWKIYQSSQGADMLESLFAIIAAPVYTLVAIVMVFIIKPWN